MTHVSSRFCRRSPRWLYIIPPYLTICALLTPRLLDAQAQTAPVIIPDQYVVVLRDDTDARAHADAAVREHGVQLLHIYEHAFKGFAFHGSAAAAQALSRNPEVEFVTPDQVVRLIEPLV